MATILVIDDSVTALKAITDALAGTGHRIITATNGEEGMRKALEEHPTLILLDVVLPGKNGFQVCRQLKTTAATQDIKVILVTSKQQPSDRFWGMKQGADAYITKPFEEADLRASVTQCL